MHGGVLQLTKQPSRLDVALMGGVKGVEVWLVPDQARQDFEGAWRQEHGETDESVRFVGIRSVWDALPYVFPQGHAAWVEGQERQDRHQEERVVNGIRKRRAEEMEAS